ncbi:MAG: erythromycin esterase family protein [Lachnospiraceae bacterium]|nr:erythromycin esterase family protein [Lachnospiraceae bacterium]
MKQYKNITALIFTAVLLFVAALSILRFGNFFDPEKKISGIEEAGKSFSEFTIPKDVRVIGIGEATHGNCEFQTAKKEVLEKVVDCGCGRSISFELSVGQGARINDAIHENETDLSDLISTMDYPIYDTQQIVDLLEWMREYNHDLPYEESLMFYGVDMQGAYQSVVYLQQLCQKGCDFFSKEEAERILSYDTEGSEFIKDRDFFEALTKRFSAAESLREKQLAVLTNVILQSADAPNFEKNPGAYGNHRDNCMALNLQQYSRLEEVRGYSQVVITAHNGHTMKGSSSMGGSDTDLTMGERINRLFEGSYYSIGTEYYNTIVNIHTAGTFDEKYERLDHSYCSDDPLAYQARFFEGGRYCLDLGSIADETSRLYHLLHSPCFFGMIGEGYSPLNDIGKADRYRIVPADRFDAILYYYDCTPIRPLHY